MSKLKKVLLMGTAYVLVAALAIGGTVAYLQDTDSDVNVMTLGNVTIEQIEQQKAEDGTLETFQQAKDLYPGTEISKIVSVKNTGKSDAYFRTLIAFEDLPNSETFGINFPISEDGYVWDWFAPSATIVIDGVTYQVYEALYTKVLKPGETSPASLTRVEFAATCTNEDMEALGGTYEILVLSQAVQTAGFENAADAFNATTRNTTKKYSAGIALDTAFGDVNVENATKWFTGVVEDAPVIVDSFADMVEVCKKGGRMILANDLTYTAENTEEMIAGSIFLINGKNVTLDLNGHDITIAEDATKIYGAIFFTGNPNGHITIVGDGNITVKNGLATIVWTLQTGTADIYGGNYTSNSASNEAMFYSQGNGGVINIYGGTYTYDLDRHLNGGFNVSDGAGGNLRIILHEGVLLSRPEYSQHLQGVTNGEQARIQLAEGCAIKEVVIDGTTWYQVSK